MADNSESWFIKLGVLFDGTGFKKFGIAAFDVKKVVTGLFDSFKKISAMGGDLYRTSKYLDISSDRLQLWENAFSSIGGNAEDARSAIDSLNFAFDKLRLGEGGGLATVAARLRLRPEDLTSFETMIEALNRSYNTYFKGSYGQFRELAKQMGLSKSAILMVTQSTEEYQRTMRRAGSVPILRQRHLKAFESLEKRFFLFSKRFDIFKAQMASSLAPALDRVLSKVEKLFSDPNMNKGISDMVDSFERLFNELANTENLEAFEKLASATVKTLELLIKVAAKIPEVMEKTSDWLGSRVGSVSVDKDVKVAHAENAQRFKKYQEMGLLDENFRPVKGYNVDMRRVANTPQSSNVTLNQTNNITGNNGEDIADEVANKTASVINPYREQRNINNRKRVTVH